jgi:N-acetylneuraminic acid mutarotase
MMKTHARSRLVGSMLSALLLTACSGAGAPSAEHTLREAFPEQAPQVLDREAGFQAVDRGFVSTSALGLPGAWARVTAELPGDASGEAVLHAPGGLEVRVREVGGVGEGVVAGRAIAYRRARGASFWTAGAAGVEEWLYAEPGEAAAGGALAAWDVEGATLQQRGDAVALVDDLGRARIQVTAPVAFCAGGKPIQARLEAHGSRVELHVAPTAGAVLVDPAWAAVPSMSTTRTGPTSVLLPNGKAFVAGGMAEGGGCVHEQSSAEIYDPVANTWTVSNAVSSEPHTYGYLVLLSTGKALLGGGLFCNTESANTELYDPVADKFSPAAPMPSSGQPVTVLLPPPSNKLIVFGAWDPTGPTAYPTVQTYDPTTDMWSLDAPMLLTRSGHTATLLPDGRILVAGGASDTTAIVNECELYDPVADKWSLAAPMATAREFHAATLLDDGTVLVVGGAPSFAGTATLASTEIYHPATDTWTPGPSLPLSVSPNAATLLNDGTVLVAGGFTATATASAERFDPVSFTWLDAGSLPSPQAGAAVVLLGDGSVLVAGGDDDTFTVVSSAARFTLVSQGGACTGSGECASKNCVDGVCCDSACGPDPCLACAKAKGATADGTCTGLTGPVCTDGNPCTVAATCMAGTCTAKTSVACTTLDPCHPGACDPSSGVCKFPAAPDGTLCDDHDACTQSDTCQGGVCVGAVPVVCQAMDACHDAVCDPQSGACVQPKRPDGTPCDDHNACTQNDACLMGACVGGTAVVCVPQDVCHAAGVCDPQTGCTNPVLPSCGMPPPSAPGLLSEGEVCSSDAACTSGHCARGVCCDSACTETCFSCALPGARGKCTAEPEGIDLNGDCGVGPNCVSTCGGDGTCTGAKKGTQCLPARCVDDHTLLGPATCPAEGAPCPEGQGAPMDCAPYACQTPFGACGTSCRTVADCAPGYVCDATSYNCTRPPDVAGGSDGGCAYAPAAPGAGAWSSAGAAVLSLLVLALRWRVSSRDRRSRRAREARAEAGSR